MYSVVLYDMIWVTMRNMIEGEGETRCWHLELYQYQFSEFPPTKVWPSYTPRHLGVHLFATYEPYEIVMGLFSPSHHTGYILIIRVKNFIPFHSIFQVLPPH